MKMTHPVPHPSSAPLKERIARDLEAFIRERFAVPDDDGLFSRTVDLWEEGYVDSAGVVEVVDHLEQTWSLKVPEEALFDPRFTRIDGMAEVLEPLAPKSDLLPVPRAPREGDAGSLAS
ncbi:MAG TPA: hypothetical protein DEF51_47745 [Myxococcales bacterium]|nr:hypothetical protein [Myxococcales bacterium]